MNRTVCTLLCLAFSLNYLWDSSMGLHVTRVGSFILTYSGPLSEHTTMYLSILLPMDFWFISHFGIMKNATMKTLRHVLGCTFVSISVFVIYLLVAQSCLTLCDPMDRSSPGSSVHGILQTRILQWVAIPFSNRPSWPRDQIQVSFVIWATREAPFVIYYCVTKYHKTQTIHTISQFLGLGVWTQLSEVLCFRSSHKAAIKVSSRARVSLEVSTGEGFALMLPLWLAEFSFWKITGLSS